MPSPLDRATALERAGDAPAGSAAALVLLEASGWSMDRKRLMPAAARERAVAVGCLGRMTFQDLENVRGLDAVWNDCVVARLLHAEYGNVRAGELRPRPHTEAEDVS